ncbi:TPA: hypothetical protein IHM15_004646 [Escherichia coli]|nr:hypothetical protein [Escherichia coli]
MAIVRGAWFALRQAQEAHDEEHGLIPDRQALLLLHLSKQPVNFLMVSVLNHAQDVTDISFGEKTRPNEFWGALDHIFAATSC